METKFQMCSRNCANLQIYNKPGNIPDLIGPSFPAGRDWRCKSAVRKMIWDGEYVKTWLMLWFTVFNMLVVSVSLQLFNQKSCLLCRFGRALRQKISLFKPKDDKLMLVDSLTLSIYFIKLFVIHGNIFTCRNTKN